MPENNTLSSKLTEFAATWFYSGKSKFAPGTCGSLATLPFVYAIAYFFGFYGVLSFATVVSLAGTPIADKHAKRLNKKDPGEIVIDETAGQSIALLFSGTNPYLFALGFALFRLFDITKPFPVGWADKKVPGGLGIMLDDIFAGLISAAIIYVLQLYGAELYSSIL